MLLKKAVKILIPVVSTYCHIFGFWSDCHMLTVSVFVSGCGDGAGIWGGEGEVHHGAGVACQTSEARHRKTACQSPTVDWTESTGRPLSVSVWSVPLNISLSAFLLCWLVHRVTTNVLHLNNMWCSSQLFPVLGSVTEPSNLLISNLYFSSKLSIFLSVSFTLSEVVCKEEPQPFQEPLAAGRLSSPSPFPNTPTATWSST